MGFKQIVLRLWFLSRPMSVARYAVIKKSTREYVDYVIKYLKPNKVLRKKERA